jgi:Putative bacterial sensory transduction regulator
MRCVYVLMAMLAIPLTAHGDLLADGGVSAAEVAAAFRKTGYPADITNERTGSPSIRSSTGKILFFVHFFQCNAQLRCASIEFTAEFRRKAMTPATIAAWNRERHFGRAFLDNHGTAWVAIDVETSHGVTTEALAANVERWGTIISAFEMFADRKEAAVR